MSFSYQTLLQETLRGKTLGRTLQNLRISSITLTGQGLDLGARDKQSSYYRFVQLDPETQITYTDKEPQQEGVLHVDLEQSIPVADASQDFLLLMNVLNYLDDQATCVSECHRVLKPGASLIGCSPFITSVLLPEQGDRRHLTAAALRALFEQNGFNDIVIEPLGGGPFSAGVSQYARIFKFKPLVFSFYALAMTTDRLLNRLFPGDPRVSPDYFPIHYFFIVTR